MYNVYRYGPLVITLDPASGRILSARSLLEGAPVAAFRREYLNAACVWARQSWESRADA